MSRTWVAVEKLARHEFAEIASRQEALQTIFPSLLDIFYHPIFDFFQKNRVFQQPPLFSTSLTKSATSRVFSSFFNSFHTDSYIVQSRCFLRRAMRRNSRIVLPVQPTSSVRVTSSTRCCPPDISPIIPDHDDVFELPCKGRRVAYSVDPVTAAQDHCRDQASPHGHYRLPAAPFRDGRTLGNQSGHAS